MFFLTQDERIASFRSWDLTCQSMWHKHNLNFEQRTAAEVYYVLCHKLGPNGLHVDTGGRNWNCILFLSFGPSLEKTRPTLHAQNATEVRARMYVPCLNVFPTQYKRSRLSPLRSGVQLFALWLTSHRIGMDAPAEGLVFQKSPLAAQRIPYKKCF